MGNTFAGDRYAELADQLRANLSRFSAYKAVHVETAFNRILNDATMTDEERKAAIKVAEERFARWTDAEYNTATARCRTAKQFAKFLEPDRHRLSSVQSNKKVS